MLQMEKEELRKHVKSKPCLSCLVRSLCSNLEVCVNWQPRDPCSGWYYWIKKRDQILRRNCLSSIIVKEEISKILRMEKEEYAKSSKNR